MPVETTENPEQLTGLGVGERELGDTHLTSAPAARRAASRSGGSVRGNDQHVRFLGTVPERVVDR